jgi:biotin-dependent carboxylase-like uncharacterized protein
MSSLKIINSGLLTTIQDYGRVGYGQYGVPAAGVMDRLAMQLANILVDNDRYEAVLEMTMMGLSFKADGNMAIAITGADMFPTVNGKRVNLYETIYLNNGDILECSYAQSGCRAYLAVSGGFDLPKVMGSKSTYLRAKIGGVNGNKIQKGDILKINPKNGKEYFGIRKIPEDMIPRYKNEITARVILGPEVDYFTKNGMETFLSSEYVLTDQCDRMGYRLEGPRIEHEKGSDIISNGINFGAIQIPGHGCPIIMMADRQTTGGYTKIANVITVDLPFLAQLKPGDRVKFEKIDIEEAQNLIKKQEKNLLNLINDFKTSLINTVGTMRNFKINVNGKKYNLSVQEIKES